MEPLIMLILAFLAIGLVISYFMNIVKLFTKPLEGSFSKAVRLLGIFVPVVGAIYGLF